MNTVVNFKQIALSDPQAEPISITQTVAYLDARFAQDDADLERALDAQAEADELAGAQDDDAAPVSELADRAINIAHSPGQTYGMDEVSSLTRTLEGVELAISRIIPILPPGTVLDIRSEDAAPANFGLEHLKRGAAISRVHA